MAVTNLGAWVGLTVTPLKLLQSNDFNSMPIIITALLLGAFLIIMEEISNSKNIKKHFGFTYANFGFHVLFVASLAGMFQSDSRYALWMLLLLAIAFYFYRKALKQCSFYFIVFTVLYTYVGISYVLGHLIYMLNEQTAFDLGLLYFIASGIGLISFLMKTNKKMKTL